MTYYFFLHILLSTFKGTLRLKKHLIQCFAKFSHLIDEILIQNFPLIVPICIWTSELLMEEMEMTFKANLRFLLTLLKRQLVTRKTNDKANLILWLIQNQLLKGFCRPRVAFLIPIFERKQILLILRGKCYFFTSPMKNFTLPWKKA